MSTLKSLSLGLALAVAATPAYLLADEQSNISHRGYTPLSLNFDFNTTVISGVHIGITDDQKERAANRVMNNPVSVRTDSVFSGRNFGFGVKQVFPKPHHIVLRAHKVMEAKNKRAALTHSF